MPRKWNQPTFVELEQLSRPNSKQSRRNPFDLTPTEKIVQKHMWMSIRDSANIRNVTIQTEERERSKLRRKLLDLGTVKL